MVSDSLTLLPVVPPTSTPPSPDELRSTLEQLLATRSTSSPALRQLLDSYSTYHEVFIAVGGAFLVAFAGLAWFSWRRFRRAARPEAGRWSFERATYLLFAGASAVVGLMLALLVVANLGNANDPVVGFSGAVDTVTTPSAGTPAADLHQAFTTWLRSDQVDVPPAVSRSIDERLAWQRPKAIICTALLVMLTILAARVWRTLLRRSRAPRDQRSATDTLLLSCGILLGPLCLLLAAMVIGNTQATIAPLSMALFFG